MSARRKYRRSRTDDGTLIYETDDGTLHFTIVCRTGNPITQAFLGKHVYDVWVSEGDNDPLWCGYHHLLKEAKGLVELHS